MSKNEENWQTNYEALKAYIDEHHPLPDKHKETDLNKLSWWKYQMKKKKTGILEQESDRLTEGLLLLSDFVVFNIACFARDIYADADNLLTSKCEWQCVVLS